MPTWIKQHPWLTALAAIGILFIAFFVLSLFIQVDGELCQRNEYTNQKECSQYQLGPLVVAWIVRVADVHNGLITAIATVLLMIITGRLVTLGREQSDTTREQLRAYVMPENASLWDTVGGPRCAIFIRGSGGTPAHRILHDGHVVISAAAHTGTIAIPPIRPGLAPSVLGPSSPPNNSIFDLGLPVTPMEIMDISAGASVVVVVGRIEYLDVFDPSKTHTTTYRLGFSGGWPPNHAILRFINEGMTVT